mgnify:CR=1 FL=1
MAKRYYLSPVIGDGSEDNPVRAKVKDYGVSQAPVIPSGPDGMPLFNWCLVVVNTVNHAPLLADVAIDALPDVPLDLKVNSIHTSARQAMVSALTKRGIDTSIITQADGYRDVIRGIGQVLQANFNENNFDVSG